MKRNLSSHAIKAMAIGMAVMLGSTTAISGVVRGSVVEVYANSATNGTTKPAMSANKYIEVPLGSNALGMFEITADDSVEDNDGTNGNVKLLEIKDVTQITESTPSSLDGSAKTKAYKGEIVGGLVKVTYDTSKFVEFKLTEVDNANTNNATTTVDATEFSKLAANLITVAQNSFKNLTFEGDLSLPEVDNLQKSLAGITVNGSLTLKDGVTLSDDEFAGSTIGSIDLSSHASSTVNAKSFKDTTIENDLKLPSNFTGGANAFDGTKVKGILDLSLVTDPLASSTFAGSTIGTLKLNSATTFATGAFDGTTITNLEHNGKALMGKSSTGGATIKNISFISGVDTIVADAFKNVTVPKTIELTGIKSIGANSFEIDNADAVSADTAVTIKMPDLETTVTDSNVDQKLPTNSFGSSAGKHIKLVLPSGVSDAVITALNTSGGKAFANTNVVVSKQPIPQATDGTITNDEPTKIKFTLDSELSAALSSGDKSDFTVTIKGGSTQTYTIQDVNGGDSSANKVVTITLDKPIEYGQTVSLTYNGAKIDISNIQITNNVAPAVNQTIQVTDANGKYTFEVTSSDGTKTVTLSGFEKVGSKGRSRRDVSRAVTFNDGKVTIGSEEYKLTKIGNGKAALVNITDKALQGHTDNVTEIADKAFEGNKSVNTLSFPQVTKVGASAFANSSVKTVDLGSQVAKETPVTIPSDAFKGASNVTSIKTNENSSSKNNAISAANGSSSSNVTVGSGSSSTEVKPGGGSGSGSGGSGSSGSSSSGSGANIGTSVDNSNANNNNNQNQNNNNNNVTTPVVEDKQLSLDVISLPSVEGEAKAFGDISDDHWAKSYIDKLSTAGIINGINGNFQPNGQTKRADVTIMLVKLLGLTPQNNSKFTDVSANAYYAPYVGAASTYGIVNGSNGMFNPEGIISRQDTMVMIGQILKSLNLNVNTDATALSKFSDLSKVAPYAQESVAILVNSGIITGNNGKLNPTAPVTRAEMATIMSKLYDVLASANK